MLTSHAMWAGRGAPLSRNPFWPNLSSMASVIGYSLLLYVAAGVVTALAFVSVGLAQVVSPPMPATLGARILFLPASFALWPYILIRWSKARRRP